MALCPIAMIPGVLRSESSMPNWISIIFGRNISQEAGKEGGKQERWYNFPPRLSSGALPCKTGNVEITSFRFRWKNAILYNMSDSCWHLLRYCCKIFHWLFPLTRMFAEKDSHNWHGAWYHGRRGERRLCAHKMAGCSVPSVVLFGAHSWVKDSLNILTWFTCL